MNEQSRPKTAGCATCGFGASVIWLFIFAHVFDDVRHGTENLFLLFIVPFLFVAAAISVWANRLLWHQLSSLAPRSSHSNSTNLPVYVTLFSSFVLATLWGKSPLFTLLYDSCKIILLILLSGVLFGLIFKFGGRFSVFASLLSAALSVIITFLVLLGTGLMSGGGRDLLDSTLFFASIGVPYAVATTLYDCYRKVSTASYAR